MHVSRSRLGRMDESRVGLGLGVERLPAFEVAYLNTLQLFRYLNNILILLRPEILKNKVR